MPDQPPKRHQKPDLHVVSDLPTGLDLTRAASPVMRLLADLLESVAANDDEERAEQAPPTDASAD